MRKTSVIALFSILSAAPAFAQAPQTPPATTLRLSVDEAVSMALDHNIDLNVDRLDPQISDTRVAAANGAFKPTLGSSFNSNNQLQPPSSFLIPTATRTDAMTESIGVGQRLSRFGTQYSLSWNAVHTNSNSFLNSYNPLVTSGIGFTLSQPLVRDLFIDTPRQQLAASRINREISDTRLRESIVHTTADVKTAYWNLVAARDNVNNRRTALELAEELARVNKAKVDVGTVPPLDLVSAQAEVASNQESLIIAETVVRTAEDRLRMLVLDMTNRDSWNVRLEPVDSPPTATPSIDLDAAVSRALSTRTDLRRAQKDIENASLNAKLADNQKRPDVRLNAAYQANGLGGTQVLRTGGFPGTIVGPGDGIGFGNVLGQLFSSDYPTWSVGVSVSYPLGDSVEQANAARTKLEQQQAAQREKSQEAKAIQQIRDAAWKVEMNGKRIETTRAARELAEQRLDAERKRLDVGMSTSFLVIQAQRDLAQMRTNELGAILSYDLALVDFDALQQAGPSQGGATPQGAQSSQGGGSSAAPAPAPPSGAAVRAGIGGQ